MFAVYARRQLSTFCWRSHVSKYLRVRRFYRPTSLVSVCLEMYCVFLSNTVRRLQSAHRQRPDMSIQTQQATGRSGPGELNEPGGGKRQAGRRPGGQ